MVQLVVGLGPGLWANLAIEIFGLFDVPRRGTSGKWEEGSEGPTQKAKDSHALSFL